MGKTNLQSKKIGLAEFSRKKLFSKSSGKSGFCASGPAGRRGRSVTKNVSPLSSAVGSRELGLECCGKQLFCSSE